VQAREVFLSAGQEEQEYRLQMDAGSRAAKVRRVGCGVVICRLGIARSREARHKQSARVQVDAEEVVGREGRDGCLLDSACACDQDGLS